MPENLWDEDEARRYDALTADLSTVEVVGPTVDLLVELADGGPALEFAIGTGRIGIPLADRGVPVTGIELSEPMVAELRAKDGERIPVVIGDMATATAPGRFRLVYLVFNTISNLLDQDEQVACFANGVPQLRLLPPGQNAVPFTVTPERLGFDTYDLVEQRLTSHHYRFGEHAGSFQSTHRYVWPAELDLMARLAGMHLVERVADWHRRPFTADSEGHVSVWRTAETT